MASILVDQAVSELVAQVRSERIAEKRLQLECQVFAENGSRFRQIHQRAQPVLVLDTVLVQIRRLRTSLFKVKAHHVLDLRDEQMQRRNEISLIALEQGLAKKPLSPLRNDRRLARQTNEVHFAQAVLQQHRLERGPNVSLHDNADE